MAGRTSTLPCVMTAAALEARSPNPPPWLNKPIAVPPGCSLSDVEWIQTNARPMVAPGLSYPALVLGAKGSSAANTIADGHHRYFILLDQGWQGRVPVVHGSGRWVHRAGR